ncbi:MAG: hypothetical protein ACTHPS_10425 [Streptosporangiaceae bacterium]
MTPILGAGGPRRESLAEAGISGTTQPGRAYGKLEARPGTATPAGRSWDGRHITC